MSTTFGDIPLLDPDTNRFPDEYAPQVVLDAVVATGTAQEKAEEAQAAAERKAQELADAKGAAGGIGSLTGAGRQPDSEVNANLTPQALSATFVAGGVETKTGTPAPGRLRVVLDAFGEIDDLIFSED